MTDYISPVDGHRHYGDAARAECAVCRLEADRDRLSEAWTVEHDAADAAAAAVGSMAAKLSTLLADNERLEDELAVYRDQALPDAATIMNGLSKALAATETQRDRLRAQLDAERAQWAKETRHAARRIGEGARERDRLRAVVRKLVKAAGITFEGDAVWYASEEYYGPHLMEPEEQAAYQRALDGSAEATDG